MESLCVVANDSAECQHAEHGSCLADADAERLPDDDHAELYQRRRMPRCGGCGRRRLARPAAAPPPGVLRLDGRCAQPPLYVVL
jgi:hypothetical protein